MIDFDVKIVNDKGEQSYVYTQVEGEEKREKIEMDAFYVVRRALLSNHSYDMIDKRAFELLSRENVALRYDIFNKLNENHQCELTKEECDMVCELVPYQYDIIISGQIFKLCAE